jgi:hypothetical protein
MGTKTWLDYVTAIGSVATPILVLLLMAAEWKIRTKLQRRLDLEDKLRGNRIEIYNEILEPFILLLTSQTAWDSDSKNKNRNKDQIAVQKMLSVDYRKRAFQLSLVANDGVVKAYNDLMQYFYSMHGQTLQPEEGDIKKMMSLLGAFLLEIRKSMGNETTKLDSWGMLEWFLTDARKFRKQ